MVYPSKTSKIFSDFLTINHGISRREQNFKLGDNLPKELNAL